MVPTKPFDKKVIAVTGAASGIGCAIANYLGERGAILSLADVQRGDLDKLAAEISTRHSDIKVVTTTVDVSNSDQVSAWMSKTVAEFGHLDGAANFAGVRGGTLKTFEKLEDHLWEPVLSVNLMGVVHSLREQLKVLSPGGSIVNAASVAGLRSLPWPGNGPYVAAKHAIVGLTKSAAREYGEKGIRVNCVCPGAIDTPILDLPVDVDEKAYAAALNQALPRVGKPEEVAALVAFLLGSESCFITGTSMVIDGGFMA
ncbi:hypothetical protein S7711_10057 [Stachybotrys chartarum IBT 7711]|uniref:Uncharacterized protein n=1 Tax=Stachybotrys chartarum (strain CBS 109288 / IBT 7711) TaxID=1280523 RepID=A0A084AEY7_STACB|nr:hypothetical protein S7711_10057 [Stachybotrys chartarum IBT 7711]